ncbi:MAG: sulfatase family protein [Planctomycetota bacterium]|jgi:arylsulfatase A
MLKSIARGFVLGMIFLSGVVAQGALSAAPPNVVIIFTDDQGYNDLSCYGSKTINTPHLDKLAAQGARFTDFHVAASVCSPSRAALLTGSYPIRTGVTGVLFPRHDIGLNPADYTIADILKTQGYATACVGKWHLGRLPKFLPTRHGFDSYFGIPYSNDMDRAEEVPDANSIAGLDRAWRGGHIEYWNVPLIRDEEEIERPVEQRTLTERYTQEAVKFIAANADRPFFLYMPHTMPHIPLFVSDNFYTEDVNKAYKATIEEIDASVGRVMAALEAQGVADNTLVVFTADNGPWLGKKHHGGSADPLRDGKFSVYEGGFRVPCIMRWPGRIPAGVVNDHMASTIDLLPTIANITGAKLPQGHTIDGHDITELITGQPGATSPHEYFYFYSGRNLRAIRHGDWKVVLEVKGRNPKPVQLFNLKDDRVEQKNLASQRPDLVERIVKQGARFDKELKANARPAGA